MISVSRDLLQESLLSLYRETATRSWEDRNMNPPSHILNIYPELHDALEQMALGDPEFADRFERVRHIAKRQVLHCEFDASVKNDDIIYAGAGYLIKDLTGQALYKSKFPLPAYLNEIGETSNHPEPGLEPISSHIAEYHAMNACLRAVLSSVSDPSRVRIRLQTDSMNLKNQMDGFSRVRNPIIQNLMKDARHLISLFESVRLIRVDRSENSEADALAEQALSQSMER